VVVNLQSTVFGCHAVVVNGADDQLAFGRQAHTEAQAAVPSFVQFDRLNLFQFHETREKKRQMSTNFPFQSESDDQLAQNNG